MNENYPSENPEHENFEMISFPEGIYEIGFEGEGFVSIMN
jgi:hypothetical protein